MSTENTKDSDGYTIEYPKFTSKTLNKIDNGKGFCNYLNIGVFQQDGPEAEPVQIGEYKRNYSTAYQTFAPFRKNGRTFALYSPDYTSTRLLEIFPGIGIKDIGGEERKSNGFCPTELYVPVQRKWSDEKEDYVEVDGAHGFVAGCVWGDDTSWKIQYVDISRAEEGIITRDERFGYIELPEHLSLKQAVRIDDVDDYDGRINISVQLQFEIATGGLIDWHDLGAQIPKGQHVIEEVHMRAMSKGQRI
jgi:hypothetical protein